MTSVDDLAGWLDARLGADDAERSGRSAGASTERRPIHTVYVAADRFHAETVPQWGAEAIASLDAHGPLPDERLNGQSDAVRAKLLTEPIEDLRIDVEDGYGVRDDSTEDTHVVAAAASLVAAGLLGTLPPFCGLRIKSFDPAVRRRGVRSLDLFLSSMLAVSALPPGFRVTLPKVTSVVQVEAMTEVCVKLEDSHGLAAGTLRFELQIETPHAILAADGRAPIGPMLDAAAGRCVGLHFGTYDYTAALGVAASQQALDHPAADFAKAVMQVAAAVAGVPVSDGSTNVLPVGDSDQVRRAWALHAGLVRRALDRGIYQGWDLHPAQLPTRFAATFAFYRNGFDVAAARLAGYLQRVQSAVAEEPATAQALAAYLLRAVQSGAVDAAELVAKTSLETADLVALLAGQTGAAAPAE